MHYYIDGYNLLFRARQAEGSLQERRELIIAQLYEKISLLHLDVTLVFDAYYKFGLGSRSHFHFLEICFTDEGETADEWILNELLSSSNPREEMVVTSDRQLAWRARRLHAKTETVEQFFQWLEKGARKRKREARREERIEKGKGDRKGREREREGKREGEENKGGSDGGAKFPLSTSAIPSMSSSLEVADPTFHAYLRIFEENFQKLIEREPFPEKKELEMDRWLRLFKERLEGE